jgi:hypothetical protein
MQTKTNLVLTALASLIIATTAQAAPITISSLPFNITAPGTYVLASDLSGPPVAIIGTPQTLITINCPVAGPIVLDLGGHTFSPAAPGGVGNFATAILIAANPTASSITIRNGTIYNFFEGIAVNTNGEMGGTTGPIPTMTTTRIDNVHIKGINFSYERLTAVWFNYASNSSVNDCTFTGRGGFAQIQDDYSQTGNQYNDNSFVASSTALEITPPDTDSTQILDRCQFEAVTN